MLKQQLCKGLCLLGNQLKCSMYKNVAGRIMLQLK